MSLCNIVNELLDKHGLAHTGTTEQTDFSAFGIRLKKINHLDSREEYFRRNCKVIEYRSRLMNASEILAVKLRQMVNSIAYYVEQTSFHLTACRNRNRMAKILHLDTSAKTVRAFHSNAPYGIFPYVLLYFKNQSLTVIALNAESCINGRYGLFAAFKRNVDHRADNLSHCSKIGAHIVY